MTTKLGRVMGWLFLFGGFFGFIPGVNREGLYLGLFKVNTAHALLHIVSGTIFLVASSLGARATLWWFRIFGAAYGALAVAGLKVGEGEVCGISNNLIDAWGHAGLALAMLVIGFAVQDSTGRWRCAACADSAGCR